MNSDPEKLKSEILETIPFFYPRINSSENDRVSQVERHLSLLSSLDPNSFLFLEKLNRDFPWLKFEFSKISNVDQIDHSQRIDLLPTKEIVSSHLKWVSKTSGCYATRYCPIQIDDLYKEIEDVLMNPTFGRLEKAEELQYQNDGYLELLQNAFITVKNLQDDAKKSRAILLDKKNRNSYSKRYGTIGVEKLEKIWSEFHRADKIISKHRDMVDPIAGRIIENFVIMVFDCKEQVKNEAERLRSNFDQEIELQKRENNQRSRLNPFRYVKAAGIFFDRKFPPDFISQARQSSIFQFYPQLRDFDCLERLSFLSCLLIYAFDDGW